MTRSVYGATIALPVVCVGLFISGLSMLTSAQTGVLEEVVVTARKREESLQKTPVAVTVMNTNALRQANIRNLGDLTQVVPGLSTRDGAKFASFSIRGVGSRGNKNVATDPAVGVYVDGIFIPRSDSQLLDVVEVQSIQVLRGPQGTLFGKNTAGGAMLVTTIKPAEEFGGELYTDVGNLGRLNLRGVVNVPVSDVFFARLTVDSRQRDGYMEDAETGIEYGDEDRIATVGQVRWLATDDLTVDLLALYSKQDERATPQSCQLVNTGTALQGFLVPGDTRRGPEVCLESEALLDDDKVISDRVGVDWEMESTMLGATLQWQLGAYSLKSITGWLHQEDITTNRDQDAGPVFSLQNVALVVDQLEANGIDADEERDFYSQELQLNSSAFDDKLDYTLGLFYSSEQLDRNPSGNMISDSGFLGSPVGELISVLPPALAGFRTPSVTNYDNKTWAAFAQGTWHFNDPWSLTAGGRYGVEDKEVEQFNYVSVTPAPAGLITRAEFDALQGTIHDLQPAPNIGRVKDDDDWDKFTPTVSLSYNAGDDFLAGGPLDTLLVYGTWSEGFKAGGFTRLADEFVSFEPEEVTSYELGVKLDALDQTLRMNLALYYMEYDDMQVNVTRQINDIQAANGIANAGEATMRGAELELSYLPTANWLLSLSYNYLDADYDEFIDTERNPAGGFQQVDRSDEDFAYAPEMTFSGSAQYRWDTGWGEFTARLAYYYKDEVFIALSPGLEDFSPAYLDDYDLWKARLTWRDPGQQNIEISLYCDNLTDEDYIGTGNLEFVNQGSLVLVPGLERTYGVQASYRF